MRLPVLLLLLFCSAHSALAQRLFRDRREAMGSTAEVLVYTQTREDAAPLFEMAFAEIERVEQLLGDCRPSSELFRLNSAREPMVLDPEMGRIMNRVLGWARQSGGAFDPTVGPLVDAWSFREDTGGIPPDSVLASALLKTGWSHVDYDPTRRTIVFKEDGMRMDPGAFGRGYALDRAARMLLDSGVTRALLSFGGSSYVALDGPPGQEGWLIYVDDPTDEGSLTTSVVLRNGALSTSGPSWDFFVEGGEPFGRLLDPRTGRPSEASIQVTVLAPNAMDADILSTAAFVLGPTGAESLLAQVPRAQAWILFQSPSGPDVRTIRWQATGSGQEP
jgi:FAD:protein FMN transferase